MKRLAKRDRLSWELRRELLEKGFSEPEIEDVLSFLGKHRLLDDEKTVQNLVERHSGKRSIGKGRIRADLIRRGMPEELAEAACSGSSGEDEADAMRQALASKKWPQGDRARAARFLISRGFEEESIESALDRFFEVEGPSSEL